MQLEDLTDLVETFDRLSYRTVFNENCQEL